MVRNASRALKIGVHLPFDPNFDVGIGTFYLEKFRQAYWSGLILIYFCNGILHSELPVFEAVVSPVGYYDEV